MLITEMLREHNKHSLIKAIDGDDADKFNYAVSRATIRHGIQLAVYGNAEFDEDMTARHVLRVFYRLQRISDGR